MAKKYYRLSSNIKKIAVKKAVCKKNCKPLLIIRLLVPS